MADEWMTYDELAARLGITRNAARVLAQRRKWRRESGNDGRARVLADIEIVRPQHERRTEVARALHEQGTDASNINALQADFQLVHEQFAEEKRQRLVDQARYEQQINDLRHQLGRFEGTETELRARLADKDEQISDLRSERDRLLGVIEVQTEQVKLLIDQRQRAPWWRRWFQR